MKVLQRVFGLTLLSFIMASFSQCSSAQKLQEKAPTKLGQVYCQTWIAGARGGGSGINIFIPVEGKSMALDSVYFRGKSVKLETKPQDTSLYIGYITTDLNNEKHDIVMNSDAKKEVGNKLPKIPKKIPFELKENECVISYKDGETTKYFKVDNVVEKASTPMMSAPMNKNN